MRILSSLIVSGVLDIDTINNAAADTDKFLVADANGVVKFRTGAEVASDIGAENIDASTLKHIVKAGVALTRGQAVYVSGADGTNMVVLKSSNASESTSTKTLGLIAQDLALNGQGYVVTEGLLDGLNTSTATIGDPVWLGVDGNLLYGVANKPVAPAHMVFMGIVTRVQTNNGEIFVKVQNGFELEELHNVLITGTPVDKAVIQYDTASGLWKNSTLGGVTASTGTAGQVAYFTGATTQAGSANLVWDAANNRLGINATPATGNSLHVNGNTFSNTISTAGGISLNRYGGESYLIFIINDTYTAQLRALSGGGLRITGDSATNEWARFHSTGNFGIGTGATDSGQRLQVTGSGYFSDSVGIGSTGLTGINLRISKNITGSVTGYGVLVDSQINSDATSAVNIFNSVPSTQAASFNIGSLIHFIANQGSQGAGSTISNQYGFLAQGGLTGASNNYGFFGNIASGTNRWNFYAGGTALNYMNGALLLGSTTDSGEKLQVTGTAKITASIIGTPLTLTAQYANGITFINTNAGVDNRNFRIISDQSTYADFYIQKSTTQGGSTYTNLLGFDIAGAATFSSTLRATNLGIGRDADLVTNNSVISVGGTNGTFYRAYTGSTETFRIQTTSTTTNIQSFSGNIRFDAGAVSNAMTLFSTGNLVVASTGDTGEKLQVTGTAKITGASTFGSTMQIAGNGIKLNFFNSGYENWYLGTKVNTTQFVIGSGTNSEILTFVNSGAATFSSSVTALGNMYVGVASGAGRFVVEDSLSSTSQFTSTSLFTISNSDQTNNNWGTIAFTDGSTQGFAGAIQTKYTDHTNNYGELHFSTRGTSGLGTRLVIDTNGAATFTSSVTVATLVKSGGTSTQYLMADGTTSTLTNPITGTGTAGQVAYWSGTSTQAGSNNLFWDNTNGRLGIGTNAPSTTLDIRGKTRIQSSGNAEMDIVDGSNSMRVAMASTQGFIGTLSSHPFGFFTAASKRGEFTTNGNFILQNGGTFIDSGQRLQVYGDTLLKGSGNTSATTALSVQNSDGSQILNAVNDGFLFIGNAGSRRPYITNYSSSTTQSISGRGIGFVFNGGPNIPQPAFIFTSSSALAYTSNFADMLYVGFTFSPTSGNAVLNSSKIEPTINQTGGANGITRGLYVNPTLTAAADWRSIEWSNNSGWGLYGAGTAPNYLGGSLRVDGVMAQGGVTSNDINFYMRKGLSGSVYPVGIYMGSVISSTSTSGATMFISDASTQAASFTLPRLEHFKARQGAIGAGSTVTSQFGFFVESTLNGATNNYGFWGDLAAATGRWNLYMNGTALNYMAGALLLGSATDSGEKLQVTGTAKITGATSITGVTTIGADTYKLVSISDAGGAGWKNNGAGNVPYMYLFSTGTSAVVQFAINNVARLDVTNTGATITGNAIVTGNLTVDTNTLFVDATANRVGIGTTNPSYTFHTISADSTIGAFRQSGAALGQLLVGNTAADMIIRILASGDSLISSDTGKYLAFGSNGGTERMRLDASGNLGIGTASPLYKLQVGNLENTSGATNDIFITGDKVNANGYYARLIFGNSTQSGGSTASIRGERSNGSNFATSLTFYTNEVGSGGNGVENMRLDANGNLLLGNTTGTSRLDVAKSASDTLSRANSAMAIGDFVFGAGLMLQQRVSAPYGFMVQATNSTAATFYPLLLQPNGGNVVLGGTTDSGEKLQVTGTAKIVAPTSSGVHLKIGMSSFVGDFTTPAIQFNTTTGIYSDSNRIFFVSAGSFSGGFTSAGYIGNSVWVGASIDNSLDAPKMGGYRLTAAGLSSGLGGNSSGDASIATNNLARFVVKYTGEIGIGTTSPNASAKLQIDSTTQGFLPPRMTAAQRTAISTPPEGLIVFQSDGVVGLYLYVNSAWKSLAIVN
jgi:hypothetical protein